MIADRQCRQSRLTQFAGSRARAWLSAIAAVAASLFVAATVPAAQANWGGESDCNGKARPENEHCYAVAEWKPNVDKNIRDVWSYITAQDVRFSLRGSPPGFEDFTTMETWVGWAVPGNAVDEPESENKWVEAGESYEGSAECHPFWAAEYGASYPGGEEQKFPTEDLKELCASKVNQLFKFVQNPSSGEVCVYYNENLLKCTPADALPAGPFTDLESGDEIAQHYEPVGIKGYSESYALGGINNRWRGLKAAEDIKYPEATCYEGNDEGYVVFSAGKADCNPSKCNPEPCRRGGEEPDVVRAGQSAKRAESGMDAGASGLLGAGANEEGPGITETSSEPPPMSEVDAFAEYHTPKGTGLSTAEIEHKALERPELTRDEWTGETYEKNLTYSTVVSVGRTIGDPEANQQEYVVPAADLTAGQKRYEETGVDVVELIGRYRGIRPEGVTPATPTLVSHINLVYSAITGELLERTWGNGETPREYLDRKELEAQAKAREKAEKKVGKQVVECEKRGRCATPSIRCKATGVCSARERCKEDVTEECGTPKEACELTSLECIHATECRIEGKGCTLEERCYAYKEATECDKIQADYNKEECWLLPEDEDYYCFNRVKILEAAQSEEDEERRYPSEGEEFGDVISNEMAPGASSWSESARAHNVTLGGNTTLERAPAIFEVTVSTKRAKRLRAALVTVKQDGKLIVTGSTKQRIRLKAGVYSVSARSADYRCESKKILATIGETYRIHISCSRRGS